MSTRLRNNLTMLLVLVFLVGCSVAPDKTTLSATTKATTDAVPTVKAVQTFKWSQKE
tara:strand:- start:66 stop:236 length:171 start_codon:yes stop_codon:yes gene_type:complete